LREGISARRKAWFRRWQAGGAEGRIHHAVPDGRPRAGGARSESLIASQPVRTGGQRGSRGDDTGKQIAGRKRHLLAGPGGRLLAAQVQAGGVRDCDGA
jgi:hypothetical protein